MTSTNLTYDAGYVEFYDAINAQTGRDYAAEAASVAELIRSRNPNVRSLLDVACGTGVHLSQLRHEFDHVEGLDLSEPMCAYAAKKVPGVPIHVADMRTFALPDKFDAVVCLFWTIGYMRDLDELSAAAERMAAHLTPGGVLVVQLWAAPDEYEGGDIDYLVVEQDGQTLIQLIHAWPRDGRLATSDMYNMVGDRRSGVRSWTETHSLGLFTFDEYREVFARTGLDVELVRWQGKREQLVGIKAH